MISTAAITAPAPIRAPSRPSPLPSGPPPAGHRGRPRHLARQLDEPGPLGRVVQPLAGPRQPRHGRGARLRRHRLQHQRLGHLGGPLRRPLGQRRPGRGRLGGQLDVPALLDDGRATSKARRSAMLSATLTPSPRRTWRSRPSPGSARRRRTGGSCPCGRRWRCSASTARPARVAVTSMPSNWPERWAMWMSASRVT